MLHDGELNVEIVCELEYIRCIHKQSHWQGYPHQQGFKELHTNVHENNIQ